MLKVGSSGAIWIQLKITQVNLIICSHRPQQTKSLLYKLADTFILFKPQRAIRPLEKYAIRPISQQTKCPLIYARKSNQLLS